MGLFGPCIFNEKKIRRVFLHIAVNRPLGHTCSLVTVGTCVEIFDGQGINLGHKIAFKSHSSLDNIQTQQHKNTSALGVFIRQIFCLKTQTPNSTQNYQM